VAATATTAAAVDVPTRGMSRVETEVPVHFNVLLGLSRGKAWPGSNEEMRDGLALVPALIGASAPIPAAIASPSYSKPVRASPTN
jgi:hypothetical protein